MNEAHSNKWKHLSPKPGSAYKQLFINGRIRARILYGMYVNEEEPRTPEEIAADYKLPIEAVREAIAYCESDPPEIREDWEREQATSWPGNEPCHNTRWKNESLDSSGNWPT